MKLASLLVRAALVLAPVLCAAAQDHGQLDSARQRWKELSPERRRELAERYERWRSMPEAERAKLRERFHCFERMRESARAGLPEPYRQKLDRLDREWQDQAMRDVTGDRMSERGRAILDMMPREWRDKLERAAPAERERLLDAFKERLHQRALERVDDLAREGVVGGDEAAQMRALPPSELWPRLAQHERRRIEREVDERGLPASVSAERWDEWKRLPATQFFERWNEARRPSCAARRHDQERRPGEPRTERERQLRDLQERLRPDPGVVIEFSRLPDEQRRTAIGRHIRQRMLEELARSPELISPAEVDELRALEGRDFFEGVQRAIPDLQCGSRSRWHHDGQGKSRGSRGERPPQQ